MPLRFACIDDFTLGQSLGFHFQIDFRVKKRTGSWLFLLKVTNSRCYLGRQKVTPKVEGVLGRTNRRVHQTDIITNHIRAALRAWLTPIFSDQLSSLSVHRFLLDASTSR